MPYSKLLVNADNLAMKNVYNMLVRTSYSECPLSSSYTHYFEFSINANAFNIGTNSVSITYDPYNYHDINNENELSSKFYWYITYDAEMPYRQPGHTTALYRDIQGQNVSYVEHLNEGVPWIIDISVDKPSGQTGISLLVGYRLSYSGSTLFEYQRP